MRKDSEPRAVALALAGLALLLPRAAAANSFDGLGVYVAAMLVGLPALGLLVAGVVTSAVGLRRGRDARAWRGWAGVALFLSPLLILAFPLAAAALEGDVGPEGTIWGAGPRPPEPAPRPGLDPARAPAAPPLRPARPAQHARGLTVGRATGDSGAE